MTIPYMRFAAAADRARLAMAVALCLPSAAQAGLGGSVDTITADQTRMMVRAHAQAVTANGTLHTLTLPNGGGVKEYVNAAGIVYAIAWNGPGKPDLRSLLGSYFAVMQADNPAQARRGLRRAPMVARGGLRIVTGGRPGAFWGYAWLPQLAPAGFDPAAM